MPVIGWRIIREGGMSMLGGLEIVLAVLLMVPIAGLFFLLRSGRFRTWLMRKSEARHYREREARAAAAARRWPFVPFPVSLFFSTAFGAAAILIIWAAPFPGAARLILYGGAAIAVG